MSDERDRPSEVSDEELDRAERIKNGRRPRGRRREQQAGTAERPPQDQQMQQGQQRQQGQQGQQAGTNRRQGSGQTQQTQPGEEPNEANLEPVTSREHDTFYLSQGVRDELTQTYRQVALDLLKETGVDIEQDEIGGLNRYFRPLALLVGARELDKMSPEELREAIGDEDLIDDLPDQGRR